MNIKVAAFTVSEKSINIIQYNLCKNGHSKIERKKKISKAICSLMKVEYTFDLHEAINWS